MVTHGPTYGFALSPIPRQFPFARVLTGPLQRARRTCELAGLDAEAEIELDLAEWEYGAFMRAFTAKGRFANLLRDVPVHVITTNAALLGAATYGLEQLTNERLSAVHDPIALKSRLALPA